MDKSSWDTFAFLGRFTMHTGPTPSPQPQNNAGRMYPEFFSSFNFVSGGGRDNCKKISKRMHSFKSREPRKYECCSTGPKDFCPIKKIQNPTLQFDEDWL